jgi:hypothetical protein
MEVRDTRSVADFQKFTFSGHLRTAVLKVIDENIRLGNADYACFWTLEMLCSGLVHSLWTQFFASAAHHIHRSSPGIFLFLVNRYEVFSAFEQQYSTLQMTSIRNNPEVRELVCSVASTLALSRKQKPLAFPTIKPHDFDPLTISEMLKAPSPNYGRAVSQGEDPLELYVPMNEFTFSLRPETRDMMRAVYWCAWILKYASQKRKEKAELVCAHRGNSFVDDKFGRHVVWLLWAAVLDASRHTPTLHPYMDAIFKLYSLRWTPAVFKARHPFLLTGIAFVCEGNLDTSPIPSPADALSTQQVIANIPEWIQAIVNTKKTFT